MGNAVQHRSGRIIALGRLLLANLFLLAIWVDPSQPTHAPSLTYGLLTAYIVFASAIVVTTWNNWWLDARLAGPAHAVDIVLFSLLVLLTEGKTSPFFIFFMFVLLSAAIRWGWQATALTAILLTLLYLAVGLVVLVSGTPFELQSFLVRIGHLIILSLILIWFGANQRRTRFPSRGDGWPASPSLDESPIESGLRAAMSGIRAKAGLFLWRDQGQGEFSGLAIRNGELSVVSSPEPALAAALATSPFLYDLSMNRALKKDDQRNISEFAAQDVITPQAATGFALDKGLAVPVRSDGGEGELFLDSIPGLSTDHIDLGEYIAAEVATHLQRHALLKVAEESAEARSRLTLARDLHDSVVQFLAGAAFRLEALKRALASGREIEPDLDELKQLMMQEQRELRSFISALRSGPLVALNDLAKDLQGLAERLSRQWDVRCDFTARPAEMMIPTRLRLDAHQLVREAVANAVRHAQAKSVTIGLEAVSDELRIEVTNDGSAFRKRGGRIEMPSSIRERVEQAGGALDMARGMGVTVMSIWLPIGEKRQ